jgi:predicted nucleic acid-binding protein
VYYLDTSAAVKLMVAESESGALQQWLDEAAGRGVALVSSVLLETELRRVAVREGIAQTAVGAVLAGIDLYEMPTSLFHEAGVLPGSSLRSLDALHLVAAMRIGASSVVVYDARMATAAQELGLGVVSPR